MSGNYEKVTLKITGMACTSCEIKIENVLSKLDGIIEVKVSFSKNEARITYNSELIDKEKIITVIKKAGYDTNKDELSNKKNLSLLQLAGIAVIIIVVWLISNRLGIFNKIPTINTTMGYGILFFIGILTSLHCIAMCGGINLSQSMNKEQIKEKADNNISVKKFIPGLLYNSGRVISYTIVGGIAGALGSVINFSSRLQGVIVIIAGFFMILMSINLIGIFPWQSKITPRIPKFIAKPLMKIKANNKGPFIIGLINGLMPCGPLQAMQLYALSTGNFITGAVSMLIFSLGTVPLMMGLSVLSAFLTEKFATRMIKISALLILFLGIGMIGRGINLSGVDFSSIIPVSFNNTTENKSGNIAVINENYQSVQSKVNPNSYESITVQKGIPVRWTLKADNSSLNGCNNAIIIPSLNIEKKLSPGDNVIEFTPGDSEKIIFTCWMGMIKSEIRVVDNINTESENNITESNKTNDDINNDSSESNNASNTSNIAVIKGGYQYVQSNVTANGYEPLIVQKGLPVKWTIKADRSSLSSCNESIVIENYNITKKLSPGENVVEFTPDKEGTITFTCWMGMISSAIKVVDNISEVTEKDYASLNQRSASNSPSCCSNSGNYNNYVPSEYFNVKNDDIGKAVIENGIQKIRLEINENGYSPKILVMQKGVKTKWIIDGKILTDKNYRMIVPAYNAKIELKSGENPIDFSPEVDSGFDSWKNDYHGFIAVVDDLKTFTKNDIKSKIAGYNPPIASNSNQGGGCCGR